MGGALIQYESLRQENAEQLKFILFLISVINHLLNKLNIYALYALAISYACNEKGTRKIDDNSDNPIEKPALHVTTHQTPRVNVKESVEYMRTFQNYDKVSNVKFFIDCNEYLSIDCNE